MPPLDPAKDVRLHTWCDCRRSKWLANSHVVPSHDPETVGPSSSLGSVSGPYPYRVSLLRLLGG